jgi:drug/metabolite transporter (DMT)-like permease
MIIALFTVSVVMMALAFINERNEIKPAARLGGIRAAFCGLINGACNLLVMTLAVTMNASIMYPVISAGGILLTGLVSLFIYKEKLSLNQYLALVLGTVSVVLMNI